MLVDALLEFTVIPRGVWILALEMVTCRSCKVIEAKLTIIKILANLHIESRIETPKKQYFVLTETLSHSGF